MALAMAGSIRHESVGWDEVAHIGAGLSYWQTRSLQLNAEHPPLAKMLAAVPLLLLGVHAPYGGPAWARGDEWVFGWMTLVNGGVPIARALWWARAPMLMLTVVMGGVMFWLGSRLGGHWGGLISATVFATYPEFLVFGPLVMTDLAVTLFVVLALWTLGEVWREPTPRAILWFGLALAGALLSKFSSGLLIFVIIAMLGIGACWAPPDGIGYRRRVWLWLRVRSTVLGLGLASTVVYLVYLIFGWNSATPGRTFNGVLRRLHVLALLQRAHLYALAWRVATPPMLYNAGVGSVLANANRPAFLLGTHYAHGVWFYFPALFFLKSPPGALGLLLLAAVLALMRWRDRRRPGALVESVVPARYRMHARALIVGFALFTGAALLSRLDIGLRHFSVSIALLALALAVLPRLVGGLNRAALARGVVIALACSCVATAALAYPNYLPYFNFLSLGRPTYWLANDSNIDFDLALPAVEQFTASRDIGALSLDYFGLIVPQEYVPQAAIWNCQTTPPPGVRWVAVSANVILDLHNCGWLLGYAHWSLGRGSMYVFQLPDHLPPPGSPGAPPNSGLNLLVRGNPLVRETFISDVQAEDAAERLLRPPNP
jgi:hypothetical protein